MDLLTEHFRLTSLDLDRDLGDLHEAYADPLVMGAWLHQDASADLDETRRRLVERRDADGARLWSVRRHGSETVLGLVELIGGTTPPGLSWMLRRAAWRQGVMGEAAPAVVEHLLGAGGLGRVEAWAERGNIASIRVARRCGLAERGRFAARHPDGRPYETVVLGRLRADRPQQLYAAEAVLPVRDVSATLEFLCAALGCEVGFVAGDPPFRAGVRTGPWTSSLGFQLISAGDRPQIAPAMVYLHCGAPVRDLQARVEAAGGRLDGPAEEMPWGRTEFRLRLPEGHALVVSGPG
ncbi:GNAT family N-acetyltransferase [Plantactinospora sp. KLBMP9567]|uniref:GNAT family N-acetyltransferase n=1 Tax=Plantactinospora sp. KLBMP9567 TaxID=3085900 RepID=UPI002980EBD1|nr:GNAT family N-acetyltransferase [Plantactinospora sp. KLBMP9567]MDW5324866.1 GNAT family N-acetyltransferase [Plantactinospora sp. KLBMP9567]